MAGEIVAIHISSGAGTPMQSLPQAEAIAGSGLQDDRYQLGTGFYSTVPTDPGARELTLIAEEALAEVLAETGIELPLYEHRRNLTTRGVDLSSLLGQRFRVGQVICEGVRDCPPCNHLEDLTGKAVLAPLVHRGGLRARILSGGTIQVGDAITPLT